MASDFRIHSQDLPSGAVYVITPLNTRALCWLIARTAPSQRPQHTIAQLDSDSLATFCQSAESEKLIVESEDRFAFDPHNLFRTFTTPGR